MNSPAAMGRPGLGVVTCAVLVAAVFAAELSGQTDTGHAVADPATAVDSLESLARLQEAAWTARSLGDTARAEAILVRLDSILRSEPRSATPLDMRSQGVSYTFRLQYEGGVAAVFKVDGSDIFCETCGVDREVAVYQLDRLLGADLTPMTVPHAVVVNGDTLQGTAMYFVHDARHPENGASLKPDRLRLFDAIIGNSDRHSANWLILADGRVVAIDHNRAFEYQPATRPKTCWETEVDSLQDPAELGPVYERYRTLPAESLAAAVAALEDPARRLLVMEMRDRVVDRIQLRAARPGRSLPLTDCPERE